MLFLLVEIKDEKSHIIVSSDNSGSCRGVAFYVAKDKGHQKAADVSVNTESGDELLVSITDTDLLTKYYENDKVIHEEKLTSYPAFALDQKAGALLYGQ